MVLSTCTTGPAGRLVGRAMRFRGRVLPVSFGSRGVVIAGGPGAFVDHGQVRRAAAGCEGCCAGCCRVPPHTEDLS